MSHVPRGRGAAENPPNRFEAREIVEDPEGIDPDEPDPRTQYLPDTSRSIITTNDSPDVGFDASLNPYRGCEHGCIYCYARPTHEYLGLSAGLDFETKIFVKENAPELLRAELSHPKWKPQPLILSGVTDAYQPVEKRLRLTRRCLEVLAEFRNPVLVITKNHLVTRDADLLADLARDRAAAVVLSVTTLDPTLHRTLEPRTASPARRLTAIRALADAGVPVGVNVAPVIPAITDREVMAILQAARDAGASFAAYVMLRLPFAVAPLFEAWLGRHFPDRKAKVLSHIRDIRGGRLNDPRFGSRMKGEGAYAEQIAQLFKVGCLRAGFDAPDLDLSTAAFRRPAGPQLELF